MLGRFASPRTVVRTGLAVLVAAIIWLLTTIDPEIDDASFAVAMALLGIGMGLLASQLGNVVQSSVGGAARSEVGGLQYTAQNLGSSLGTALIGSIVIGALATAFTRLVAADERVSEQVQGQVGVGLEAGINFVPTETAAASLERAGVPAAEAAALLEDYADAQLLGLKVALLAAAVIALAAWLFTRHLPAQPLVADAAVAGVDQVADAVEVAEPRTAGPGTAEPDRTDRIGDRSSPP
jgi:dipeptide/tripeptide permease